MNVLESFRLEGRIAVVTGGKGHLGTAISEALAEAGAVVIVASRSADAGPDLRAGQDVQTTLRIQGRHLDVSSRESVRSCFYGIFEQHGRLDILVNNAFYGASAPLEGMSDEQWLVGLDGILGSVFRCMSEAVPIMRKAGGGRILNIASMYGLVSPDDRVYPDQKFASPPNYGAAKAGVIQLTRHAACHLSRHNIRVNALSPGAFPSPAVQQRTDFITNLANKAPMARIGHPEELKGAVVYLCSDASSFVTGHNLVVDGGWTAW